MSHKKSSMAEQYHAGAEKRMYVGYDVVYLKESDGWRIIAGGCTAC